MTIRLGIIGAGNHFYKKVMPSLKIIKNVKIEAIYTRAKEDDTKLGLFTEKNFFKKKLDFVYISTPSLLHYRFIIKCLKNNLNIICEKPFCTNLAQFQRIAKIAKKNNKLIFEVFAYRFHPVFDKLKKILEKKTFGKIKYLESCFTIPSLEKRNNRYDLKTGGGFFFDLGVYLISLENLLIKKKINMKDVYLNINKKKLLPLRGSIQINKPYFRNYSWGEGLNYSNFLLIIFENSYIYVNKFFSKGLFEKINMHICKNNKIKVINFDHQDQFVNMFNFIFKNFKKKSFKKREALNIKGQINLIKKFKYEH